MDFPIDFVVTWVDGSDEHWLQRKRQYEVQDESDDGVNRYRDYGLLKNWFDRVWQYAPWVRKVFLVTDGQAPRWAKEDNRITVINHTDFIPAQYLPLYNSNAIELNLWRINELAEHFVYFNDDMYLAKSVSEADFFSNEGLPILNGSLRPVMPRDDFSKEIFKNMVLVNKTFPKREYFKRNWKKYINPCKYGLRDALFSMTLMPYSNWVGFFEDHLVYPNLKSWFQKLNIEHPDVISDTSKHRFRMDSDYTIWLLKNMYLASGNFEPRNHRLGKMLTLKQSSDLKIIEKALKNDKVVIIEDDITSEDANTVFEKLKKIMEKIN